MNFCMNIYKILDWSSYSAVTISTIINWDTLKGNISFGLGCVLVITSIIVNIKKMIDKRKDD